MDAEVWMNLHEREMVEDIAALVEIPSVAYSENKVEAAGNSGYSANRPYGEACRKVLDTMLQLGERYGFNTSDCDGYAGEISWEGTGIDAQNSIGVWGHLDVVPAGDGWAYPPYQMSREGDFLIGRGVQDNKGPLISALYAFRYLKDIGWKPKKRLRLIFGCNEEQAMDDVTYFLAHRQAPVVSFVADCGFPVCRGEKGVLHLELVKNFPRRGEETASLKVSNPESEIPENAVLSLKCGTALNIVPDEASAELWVKEEKITFCASGTSGHAAFPEGTKHAAEELCGKLLEQPLPEQEYRWIVFLQKICGDGWGTGLGIQCRDQESGPLTCNAGLIDWEDGICRVQLDIRYPVTVRSEEFLRHVEAAAQKEGFTYHVKKNSEPFWLPEDHPLVCSLMKVYRQEQIDGKTSYIMGGGTYAKKIPNAVGFGPGMAQHFERIGFTGSRGNCHSVDEAQSVTNLKLAMKIYVNALVALDNL